MADFIPQYTESNILGTLDAGIDAVTTTIVATFLDRVTGESRPPQSTTKLYVIDKGSESFPNSRYEIILAGTVSTVNGVTTLSGCTRNLPWFGISTTGSSGMEHSVNAEIGCVDVHLLWNILMAALDGTSSLPTLLLSGGFNYTGGGRLRSRVFVDTVARDAAIPSPVEGDECEISGLGLKQDYIGGTWVNRANGTNVNAAPSIAGKVEAGTVAQQAAHTAVGPSGALPAVVTGNLITTSAGAGDAGKIPVLASNGRFDPTVIPTNLQISTVQQSYIFGENINGTTTPQAVYEKASDGKIYRTVGFGTESTYKFIGFVITNVTSGNTGSVIVAGVVPGFTGLTANSDYYISDSTGAISLTAGVNIYKVARADTTSSVLIEKGAKIMTGVDDYNNSSAATVDTTITLGFRPKRIKFSFYIQGHDSPSGTGNYGQMTGIAHYLGNTLIGKQIFGRQFSSSVDNSPVTTLAMDPLFLTDTSALEIGVAAGSGSIKIIVTINNITDTGFVIRKVTTVDTSPSIARSIIIWEAEA